MVKSGLERYPDKNQGMAAVSPLRLSAHFSLATFLYVLLFSTSLDFKYKYPLEIIYSGKVKYYANGVLTFVIITGLLGILHISYHRYSGCWHKSRNDLQYLSKDGIQLDPR
jgi:heme A synthase